ADGDKHGGKCQQPGRKTVPAEQEYAKKGRLEVECCQDFIADQWANDVAGKFGKTAPVGAELVGEHDAGDHAHGKRNSEDLGPEASEAMVFFVLRAPPCKQQHGDEGRQTDREGGEDDVEGYREGKLDSCQKDGIQVHASLPALNAALSPSP